MIQLSHPKNEQFAGTSLNRSCPWNAASNLRPTGILEGDICLALVVKIMSSGAEAKPFNQYCLQ